VKDAECTDGTCARFQRYTSDLDLDPQAHRVATLPKVDEQTEGIDNNPERISASQHCDPPKRRPLEVADINAQRMSIASAKGTKLIENMADSKMPKSSIE